jgi:hypothetical protein
MIERKDCEHTKLTFGSGDFYLFCYECGATWATIDVGADRLASEKSNQGIGSRLSGEARSKIGMNDS